jgi:hypothetical protein
MSLTTENARLRAALERIVAMKAPGNYRSGPYDAENMVSIARTALSESPSEGGAAPQDATKGEAP